MRRQEWSFLGQLFVLVVFTGGYALLSLSSPPPNETIIAPSVSLETVKKTDDPFYDEDFTKSNRSDRSPASIPSISASSQRSISKSVVTSLNWGCEEASVEKIETESFQIRINGKCQQNADLTITNKSNGYSASIFKNEKNLFTTDFIQLSEGENILEVQSLDKMGKPILKHIRVLMTRNEQD